MDEGAIDSAATVAARSFRDFPEATRAMLEALEEQLPGTLVFLGLLDAFEGRFSIVDARGSAAFGLEPGTTVDIAGSFCVHMADGRAPQLCNHAAEDPVYGALDAQSERGIASYLGVPLELSDGSTIGSLCALSDQIGRFSDSDLKLVGVMARMLAYELERQQRERDLEALTQRLREQARTDGLTGLLNKSAFMEALEREWRLTRRDGVGAHVVMIDLDEFKKLNDTCGHAAGDEVLRRTATGLRATTRDTDLIGRVGGDEFAVVLVRSCHEAPQGFERRLARALPDVPFSLGLQSLDGTPSACAALALADQAMYAAKSRRTGRAAPAR